ncbi:MAG: phosphopyruvate hydratase [Candidatus Parcubacteria bacterium]|nr:phosphopyruvate hydratase [Candidatus Parcubacteria bacterium]
MNIKKIKAREILDSKGMPTLEVSATLEDGSIGIAGVPSGASTGKTEAVELRDGDKNRYFGKGVLKAAKIVNTTINTLLKDKDAYDQKLVDDLMIEADGSENKAKLGGNSVVGVSIAVCKAAAKSQKLALYKYFGKLMGINKFVLPQPQVLVLEGGKHGGWSTDIQEFFVIPKNEAFKTFSDRLRVGAEVFYHLGRILEEKDYAIGVGFEGAYCPNQISSNEEAFELIIQAVEKAGYSLPDQVVLGVDAAASEFLPKKFSLDQIVSWTEKYPIWSLEDMFDQEDWRSWSALTARVGNKLQVIGDDLLTTNVSRIQKAIDTKACNSVLIKLNQIGTVTETLAAIKLSHKAGFTTTISHRGGETNDDTIADLAVGSGSWQCKFGGPDRGERLAKYNRLTQIEAELK